MQKTKDGKGKPALYVNIFFSKNETLHYVPKLEQPFSSFLSPHLNSKKNVKH